MAHLRDYLSRMDSMPAVPTVVINFDMNSLAETLAQRLAANEPKINPQISPG